MNWLKILESQRNLDVLGNVERIEDVPFYLVNGVNGDSDIFEQYIVYDFHQNPKKKFDYEKLSEIMDGFNEYQTLIVFKNMDEQQEIFWGCIEDGRDEKSVSKLFSKTIYLYEECTEKLTLEVDSKGINYLEYPSEDMLKDCDQINSTGELKGYIYNMSFLELRKIFNVTGSGLFKYNVRYGLVKHPLAEKLTKIFTDYFVSAIHEQLMELIKDIVKISKIEESLGMPEIIPNSEESVDIFNMRKPAEFWFYHNGVTIFCLDELEISRNHINIMPSKLSVINGAQTITNFFNAYEEIKRKHLKILKNQYDIEISMTDLTKKIYVKTIFVKGDVQHINPITMGLNTQIPIGIEHSVAIGKQVEIINSILEGKVRILKGGETVLLGRGYMPLDFMKRYLLIIGLPGESKNYRKSKLEKDLPDVVKYLKKHKKCFLSKEIILNSAETWWKDFVKNQIKKENIKGKEEIILSYGKNYFLSFVAIFGTQIIKCDFKNENSYDFNKIYEEFRKNVYMNTETLDLKVFKTDHLWNQLIDNIDLGQLKSLQEPESVDLFEINQFKDRLIAALNFTEQSQYTYSKTISEIIENRISNFRVISLENDLAKEAFPFSSSTFSELYNSYNLKISKNQNSDITWRAKKFENSLFKQEVSKPFSVFIIRKIIDNGKHVVVDIDFILEFSFIKYIKEASEVYNKTLEAFYKGDEFLFPKTSDKLKFHVRPKAVDANDTFEFTNGKLITKRTFWANKETVNDLIKSFSEN